MHTNNSPHSSAKSKTPRISQRITRALMDRAIDKVLNLFGSDTQLVGADKSYQARHALPIAQANADVLTQSSLQ